MTDTTARLALPMLQPGQAQKELAHNESLALVDIAAQASVEAVGRNDPPAGPVAGQCWIVGATPTGAWTGQAGALAGWTAGGWRFLPPREGMTAWDLAGGCVVRRIGAAWVSGDVSARRVLIAGKQVVGARQSAIAAPAGGAVMDGEARAVLNSVLLAMRAHGLIDP